MADRSLAFDTLKCDVEAVERIPPCETLLLDPTVPPAPDPIVDCPTQTIDGFPADPPCPTITPNIPTTVTLGDDLDTDSQAQFGFNNTLVDGCVYAFDLTINVRPETGPVRVTSNTPTGCHYPGIRLKENGQPVNWTEDATVWIYDVECRHLVKDRIYMVRWHPTSDPFNGGHQGWTSSCCECYTAVVMVTGPRGTDGMFPGVIQIPRCNSTTTTTTTPDPSSTTTTLCPSTSTTINPDWDNGDTIRIKEINGDWLGYGCRFPALICPPCDEATTVVAYVQSNDKTADCATPPDGAQVDNCYGQCTWGWDKDSKSWTRVASTCQPCDPTAGGCGQCDEPQFCLGDAECGVTFTNCQSSDPIAQPRCDCTGSTTTTTTIAPNSDCFSCQCYAKPNEAQSLYSWTLLDVVCGQGTDGSDAPPTNCDSGCLGCPRIDNIWNFGREVSSGKWYEMQGSSQCGGTTTTTTTTTSTIPPDTCTGCDWHWIPLLGWRLISYDCQNGCYCRATCPYPGFSGEDECVTAHTDCDTRTDPPPPPGCSGSCLWVSDGLNWLFVHGNCHDYCCIDLAPCALEYTYTSGCHCRPPTEPPKPCGTPYTANCKCNDCDDSGTTTTGDPDTTTTSTTLPPCTTTTKSPDCVIGECIWLWQDNSGVWKFSGRTCGDGCPCDQPVGSGQVDCEVQRTPCTGSTTTTTTTTSTTTTTTTGCPCETNYCCQWVSSFRPVGANCVVTVRRNCATGDGSQEECGIWDPCVPDSCTCDPTVDTTLIVCGSTCDEFFLGQFLGSYLDCNSVVTTTPCPESTTTTCAPFDTSGYGACGYFVLCCSEDGYMHVAENHCGPGCEIPGFVPPLCSVPLHCCESLACVAVTTTSTTPAPATTTLGPET